MKRPAPVSAIFLLSILIFLPLSMIFLHWIPDDAYISFCYARHLAEGQGLVFYPGEKVEGFSNFLWTLYLGGISYLGADIVRTAVITSLLSALGALFLIARLFRTAGIHAAGRPGLPDNEHTGSSFPEENTRTEVPFLEAGCIFLSAVFFPLIFYATSGLETASALFFLVLGAVLHLEARKNRRPPLHFLSVISFLAVSLLRPEGVLFLLINTVYVATDRFSVQKWKFLYVFLPVLSFGLFILAKFLYFGSFVPNTYYSKPGASLHYLKPLALGSGYLVHFFIKSGFVLLLPFAVRPQRETNAAYARRYMWSLILGQLFFIVFVGGDILRFDRFTLPFFPFFLALSYMGIKNFMRNGAVSRKRFMRIAAILVLLILVILNVARIPLALKKRCYHDWMHARVQKETGHLLGGILPEGSCVVTNEVGAFAYYSKLPVVDMIGLTDKTVGRFIYQSYMNYGLGGSEWSVREISKYLLSREPDCFIIPAYEPLSLDFPEENKDRMHLLWYTIFSDMFSTDRFRFVFYIKVHEAKYSYIFSATDLALEQPLPPTGRVTDCLQIMR